MIKVIKPGRKPEPQPRWVDCPNCGAELEYTEVDVQSYGPWSGMPLGIHTTDHIACPECNAVVVVGEHRPCVGRWRPAF